MKIVNEQIEVIAAFLQDGVRPLRFRRLLKDDKIETYKIVKIIKTSDKPGFFHSNAMSFTCQTQDDKICEILYDFDHGKWILLKI